MAKEIEQMMNELAQFRNSSSKSKSLLPSLPSAAPVHEIYPKVLLNPVRGQAQSEYAGPDWRYLLIKPGDIIVVYAYLNESTAIGFNTQTGLGGRFPFGCVKVDEEQVDEGVEVYYSTSPSGKYSNSSPSSMVYAEGHYVRVCRWEKDTRWTYAFNQSTLYMGRIFINSNFKKVDWNAKT